MDKSSLKDPSEVTALFATAATDKALDAIEKMDKLGLNYFT